MHWTVEVGRRVRMGENSISVAGRSVERVWEFRG